MTGAIPNRDPDKNKKKSEVSVHWQLLREPVCRPFIMVRRYCHMHENPASLGRMDSKVTRSCALLTTTLRIGGGHIFELLTDQGSGLQADPYYYYL